MFGAPRSELLLRAQVLLEGWLLQNRRKRAICPAVLSCGASGDSGVADLKASFEIVNVRIAWRGSKFNSNVRDRSGSARYVALPGNGPSSEYLG